MIGVDAQARAGATIARGATLILSVPVILIVLAATAVPVELRPLDPLAVNFEIDAFDVIANVAAYIPLGLVLRPLGILRSVMAAALLATVAEASQFTMMHRVPSAIDLATNVIGAAVGTAIAKRWNIRQLKIQITRRKAFISAMLSIVLIVGVWATSGAALNDRGATSAGTLEAHWEFNESAGRTARDSSGHGLHGKFSTEPRYVVGVMGGAVSLDGASDYIDFGRSTSFRLVGNMTITAWIKSTSFPADDAAIVSQLHNNLGYQLDTTVDTGPRTIGLKLTNDCGELMARYGATPLTVDTWYHVAGVYDAQAQTLSVYLNGRLDNGMVVGSITRTQRSSRAVVYVGRRSDSANFGFAGYIDDVRIYSLALTQADITAVMHGKGRAVPGGHGPGGVETTYRSERSPTHCVGFSEPEDMNIPLAAALLGVTTAVAAMGVWPSAGAFRYVVVSFLAGFALFPTIPSNLPQFNWWTILLLSLLGGVSVAISLRRDNVAGGQL